MSEVVTGTVAAEESLTCDLCCAEEARRCPSCAEPICADCGMKCESCTLPEEWFCPDCAPPCSCDRVVCGSHAMTCPSSGKTICLCCGVVCLDCDQWYKDTRMTYCSECDFSVCEGCRGDHAAEHGCSGP